MPDETLPELAGRLEVIELHPHDVLVLRFPGLITEWQGDRLRKLLEQNFPGHRCVVLGDGATLDVLREVQPE